MKFFYYLVIFTMYILSINVAFANTNNNNKTYSLFLYERLNYITTREYSTSISDVYVGLVNYPQWFVTLSTGMYNGLTMHKTIKGSESLYPTNVTQQRWMHSFNTSTLSDIDICKRRIANWTDIPNLKLVMYSQAMVVCLSSNSKLLDNEVWYDTCWRKYHSSCRLKRDRIWI